MNCDLRIQLTRADSPNMWLSGVVDSSLMKGGKGWGVQGRSRTTTRSCENDTYQGQLIMIIRTGSGHSSGECAVVKHPWLSADSDDAEMLAESGLQRSSIIVTWAAKSSGVFKLGQDLSALTINLGTSGHLPDVTNLHPTPDQLTLASTTMMKLLASFRSAILRTHAAAWSMGWDRDSMLECRSLEAHTVPWQSLQTLEEPHSSTWAGTPGPWARWLEDIRIGVNLGKGSRGIG